MIETSREIYDLLLPLLDQGWVPMKEVGAQLGISARGLRMVEGKSGIIDAAILDIYRENGLFVITRSGKGCGICLTSHREELKRAHDTLNKHVWNERKRVVIYETILSHLERPTDIQLEFT